MRRIVSSFQFPVFWFPVANSAIRGLETGNWKLFSEEIRVIFSVGNKVVYPCQGPCIIDAVFARVVDGRPKSFYHLVILGDGGGELFVPVEKVQAIGIRPLLEISDIPKLLDQLTKTAKIAKGWRQRADDNSKLFTSGSAFDLAEIVGSLTELKETKELSIRENWILDRARQLLVCEIAVVMEETESAAREQVDQALKGRKPEGQSEPYESHTVV
jgi:CarD family transcriptional regulator